MTEWLLLLPAITGLLVGVGLGMSAVVWLLLSRRVRISTTDQPSDDECLRRVRESLDGLGVDMSAYTPLSYDLAIRSLALIVGRQAGCQTLEDVRRIVAAHVHHTTLGAEGETP